MPAMTRDDLTAHVKGLIQEYVTGSDVKDAILTAVREATEPLTKRQSLWEEKILGASSGPQRQAAPVREKGVAFARCVRAAAAAKLAGQSPDYSIELLKRWGDADLAEAVTEGRSKALAAGDPTAGGFLVPTQFSQDVIQLLYPMSIVRRMGPLTLPMPTGTVRVPKLTSGATAYWVGENANITPGDPAFGQITLSFKKLAAVVPLSNDLIRYSSPGADTIVRTDVVRALATAEDQALLRNAGTAYAPKGLRYWAPTANVIAATTAVALATVTTDLGQLVLALKNANVPMTRPGWLMAPRSEHYLKTVQNTNGFFVYRDEMNQGRLWGMPYAVSTNIPINLTDNGGTGESEVYLVDFDDCVIGEGMAMEVQTSWEAAYYDGSNVVSALSQDQTVVRVIEEIDFAVRRDVAVAVLYGVKWGA